MTQEENMKHLNKKLTIFGICFVIFFLVFYSSFIYFISELNRKELEHDEAGLSAEIINQCRNIAKAQERKVSGGMTVHSSYGNDYEECLVRSAIHKNQYGKEDLIKM
jgi:Na+-transporting methylmalonyl-CoA/oxaloacetate decarboxylase gamma subunit